MAAAATPEIKHLHASTVQTSRRTADVDEDRARIPLHPQGGSDLRLLMLYSADAANMLRTRSFAMAQAIRAKG